MQLWSVAIIGGGPGGLMTAYQLQKRANRPYRVTLYEASGRLGGKIVSPRFAQAPISYEGGAAELYDYSGVGPDPLKELIAELGLTTQSMDGGSVILGDTILTTDEDLLAAFGAPAWDALAEFDRRAKEWMTPKQYYEADWKEGEPDPMALTTFHAALAEIPDATVRRYIEKLVHSDLATEPRRTNAFYGLQNYLMNDPAYMELYTIDGGIERLPEELAKRIEATVLLREPVTKVERSDDDRLAVTSRRDGELRTENFDFLVVALPNNWLPHVEWAGDLLPEAMERHHAHYDYPAHYLRVTILFESQFWRDFIDESFFMLEAFGGCCVYDESSRNGNDTHGVLGWLLGGEPAVTLSNLTDAELVPLMLDSLPPAIRHGRTQVVESRVHRWCGSVNGLPAGVPARDPETRHLPEPIDHPDLFVVGDYLFDSTLNGVLDSADFVAEWLVEEMEDEPVGGRATMTPNGTHPERATLRRIAFAAKPIAGHPALVSFAHPTPVRAVVLPADGTPATRDGIDILTMEASPKDNPASRGELHAWVAEGAAAESPPVTITLHGGQIVWRPGRASILASAERLEPLLLALLEFAHYENELRKLEEEIEAAWPELELDTPLAYDVTDDDLDRHEEIGRRMDANMKRRIRFARIESPLYHPSVARGLLAAELGDRLRDKARVESRLETVDGHIEVFEYVYEMGSQRMGEFRAARKERTLEWLIIVLLAAEVLMLLIDLLWTLEV